MSTSRSKRAGSMDLLGAWSWEHGAGSMDLLGAWSWEHGAGSMEPALPSTDPNSLI